VLGYLRLLDAAEAGFADLKASAEIAACFAELRVAADRAQHAARRYNDACDAYAQAASTEPARSLARSLRLAGYLRFAPVAREVNTAPAAQMKLL
jgi:hypothetical protein